MTTEEKNNIVSIFNERIPTIKCPMCGHDQFTLVDGYSMLVVQDGINSTPAGQKTIPVVTIACTRCGYLSSHAVGTLGLLKKEN